jgi:hypothetical protein
LEQIAFAAAVRVFTAEAYGGAAATKKIAAAVDALAGLRRNAGLTPMTARFEDALQHFAPQHVTCGLT